MAMQALLMGKWITSGEYVARFQNVFAQYFGVKYAHMVNSGSSANLVMIAALKKHFNWQDGDEVIVSPVGFPTTIAPLMQHGLKPVFADIELNTLNFNLDQVEAKITPKTKAIIVSPVLGNPPDMDRLKSMAEYHGIKLIGDNCDSIGTRWNTQHINKYYFCWSSSFYPAHHISTGEGGMVCCDDKRFIDEVRSISWWGRDCYCVGAANLLSCGTCGKRFDKWLENEDAVIDHKYVFTNVGYNLKPLDLQGAIGLAQMEKMPDIERRRREYKTKISQFFAADLPVSTYVRMVETLPQADPCWFGVPIYCHEQVRKERFVAFLEENKIQTRSYFAGNILKHPAYKHLDDAAKYPNANLALTNVLFIGCAPHYTPEIIKYIGEKVKMWAELEAKRG